MRSIAPRVCPMLVLLATCAVAGRAGAHPEPHAAAPAAISGATPSAAQWSKAPPRLDYRFFSLANGLRVFVIEDHRTPMVHEVLWVKVGSKDEEPRRTGFAHLFEHLMFKGSAHLPDGKLDQILEAAGGWSNAFTSSDMTVYQNVAAAPFLERVLWIEADRLAGLLGSFDAKKLDNQRDVVLNERRQSYENEPYGVVELAMPAHLWPPGHGYRWPTIGEPDDLRAATVDDVAAFFRKHYVPANATMVIAGAVRFDEVKRLVEKYFAWMPAAPAPPRAPYTPPPPLAEPVELSLEDDVQVPRVHLAWRGPAAYTTDEPALDLALAILGEGKSSRLVRRLVYEEKIAQDVSAGLGAEQLAGTVRIDVTAKPGVDAAKLARAVAEEIAKLAAAPPEPAALERAKASYEADFLHELEPSLQRAIALAEYDVLANDPDYFAKDLERYRAVTSEDVRRAVATYLVPRRRVAITVVPRSKPTDKPAPAPKPAASPPVHDPGAPGAALAPPSFAASAISNWRAVPPAGPESRYKPPEPASLQLGNGLRVLFVERPTLPIFALALVVPGAGAAYDPPGRFGLASFTADMLDEGAAKLSALELAAEEERLGASLELYADYDIGGAAGRGLSRSFDATLELMTKSLTEPAFDEGELSRVRGDRLTALAQRPDRPREVAGLMLGGALYGADAPYGHSIAGTPAAIGAITADELRAFFRARWHPAGATLIIVGDVDRETLAARLEATIGRWRPLAPRASAALSFAPRSAGARLLFAERAGAEQTDVRVGLVGPARSDRRFYAFEVLRAALGGGFTSRLVQRLREDLGITYGAVAAMDWRSRPGPFSIATAIVAEESAKGVVEIFAILRALAAQKLPAAELAKTKQNLIRALPAELESNFAAASAFAGLVQLDLPPRWLAMYAAQMARVTAADVQRAAKELLPTGRMIVSAVGDKAALEAIGAALAPIGVAGPPRWHDGHGAELLPPR